MGRSGEFPLGGSSHWQWAGLAHIIGRPLEEFSGHSWRAAPNGCSRISPTLGERTRMSRSILKLPSAATVGRCNDLRRQKAQMDTVEVALDISLREARPPRPQELTARHKRQSPAWRGFVAWFGAPRREVHERVTGGKGAFLIILRLLQVRWTFASIINTHAPICAPNSRASSPVGGEQALCSGCRP